MRIKTKLFSNLDFNKIETEGFNEADVRAVIIDPILKELGFSHENIMRNKALKSPFLKIGSKKRAVNLIPDYALKVESSFAWVLDAKASNQKIVNSDNVEQVYSYATHPEIRSNYFALCNGLEFACYRTTDTENPVLYFCICEIDEHWQALQNMLSSNAFQGGKRLVYTSEPELHKTEFDYNNRLLLGEIPVKKQQAKRHFGVHGYFTRQAWNVVAEYIKNFSKPGDVVLDPFGGSGVTAVEALVNKRKAISLDINPLSVFIMQSLLAPVKFSELAEAYNKVCEEYEKKEPKTKKDVKEILANYPLPKKIALPKNSDVEFVTELFSDEQMAQLALLKSIIKKVKDKNIRNTLLLVFSSSINKHNLTFHYTQSAGGGDSAPFRYYRYRIAPKPGTMPLFHIFETKYKKIRDAKKEIEAHCLLNQKSVAEAMNNVNIIKGTATNLSFLQNESVDYIYTDPPYGKKIPYLDLSIMWNAWLDLKVSEEDYQLEAIEGGEHNKTKDNYNSLIAKSIQEMYRVLKFDRWLSFVFAHKDPEFWHLIIETCEKCGFEYIGAVPQKNGQTSFKKRQNPFTVLSGELIINFRKVRSPRAVLKANLGMDIDEVVLQTIEGIIAKHDGATLEQINDELIIKGLELGFLDLLKKYYTDLSPLLLDKFDYDSKVEKYNIKKNTRFQTHIDIRLRIRYYLLSYLRRMERQNIRPTFDEIVLYILPLLKNGITPERQTILSVLEDIGEKVDTDSWRLKKKEKTLFDLNTLEPNLF
ncbi:MAG: type I restriction enzyme HsdR N-terminal domain-containing protein [Fibromonadaceae bacterium]|jgi:16S rRNA G966 N2-methylase RsmD|nr:type I restriction enzyme HsdR N-terminal domain-containing protein [Fibromonadaceae bacterium]